MRISKFFTFSLLLCALTSCNAHKAASKDSINPELVGSWANDSGCFVTFIRQNNKLILQNFNNSSYAKFNNIELLPYKESIFSKFKAKNPNTKFTGMFTEGVVIINNYCKEALHKVDK